MDSAIVAHRQEPAGAYSTPFVIVKSTGNHRAVIPDVSSVTAVGFGFAANPSRLKRARRSAGIVCRRMRRISELKEEMSVEFFYKDISELHQA